MRGLDPRIHLKKRILRKTMDCRVTPGNDDDIFRKTVIAVVT
jgi:hypothetical protein